MVVGFTGSQMGMPEQQLVAVNSILYMLELALDEARHGDCIGADAEFHALATDLGVPVVIHPPIKENKRAFCDASLVLPPKDYIQRNHDIVDASRLMIAAPSGQNEVRRSGTWATVRYARMTLTPLYIVYPDGEVSYG